MHKAAFFGAFVIVACGGRTTTDLDAGADGSDAQANDAGACVTPPHTPCTNPCPSGTVCLRTSGPTEIDLGCTPIAAACNGVATCDCMTCFCPNNGIDKCYAATDGSLLLCSNGTISRREFKKDIAYVSDAERAEIAHETLAIPLATYRYKSEGDAEPHLGFIIDDQPEHSPAVASDATHVDLYGYTSMLVATVQEQQKQIDALEKQVGALQELTAGRKGTHSPSTR